MEKLSKHDLGQFFAEDSLFSKVSEEALDRLAGITRQRLLRKGERLFSMGQASEALHFIVLGSALLIKTSPEGRQRILHRALPGEIVGAAPFFDGKGYPATFTAETDSLVASLPRDDLLSLLRTDLQVVLSIFSGVVGRLRMMTDLVEQMSFHDTTHRLWNFLVKESASEAGGGDEYPRVFESLPTREHIAESIGTVREVVSRRLSALVESGHVRIEGRRLVLLRGL